METRLVTCDIKDCKEPGHKVRKKMQVVFTTDQTEGRPVTPYLDEVVIDLCSKHLDQIIKERKYIIASGCQGYNTYLL